MVFNAQSNALILFVLGIWLTILTWVVVRMLGHYNRVTSGSTKTTLTEVLNQILSDQEKSRIHRGNVDKIIEQLTKEGKLHMQRVGVVRFNPFADTGGSQSLTLALLDGVGNGIVMTSLYARGGNRWYVKEVHEGKSRDVELSKEELSAIKRAQIVS